MDTPKLEVSWLEYFPPDIWAYIVWYLPGEQLGRLMMTGAMLLWHRLKSPHVVKSIKLGKDFITFKMLPRFLNELPTLNELLIDSCNGEWSNNLGLTVASIPSGVRKLELSGKWIRPNWFLESSNHLSHLTSLNIMPLIDSEHSWMINSPPNLTFLSLNRWNGSVALPSSLLHFKACNIELSTSFVSRLPPSLESFVTLDELRGVELLVPLFPPSTRKLHLGRYIHPLDPRASSCVFLEQLPNFLTSFAFPQSYEINFETNPKSISLLPTTLTELRIRPELPCSVWHLLPPNLKKLSFVAPTDFPKVNFVDANGVERELPVIPYDLLPRSLTRLVVRLSGFNHDHFCGPPSTTINHSYFPPNLTHLKLSTYLPLLPQTVKLLPSSLTFLEISNLCEQVCQYLPTGLKTLISRGTLMSPKLINFLPRSLTFLKLELHQRSEPWFDYKIGELVSVSALPEYSIHEKCLSNNFDWKQTSPLPSTLIHLEVSHPNELGDLFLPDQQLPNLLELKMGQSQCFTDLSIPSLPRHLTTLDLRSSSMVSGKSFKFLPRHLSTLDLNSSESIFDSDIQYLPRTLKRLYLGHAIHLTELCIADLPPHLEILNSRGNSNISSSSFPSFPYSLRSRTLERAVYFKKWNTRWGKIHQIKEF